MDPVTTPCSTPASPALRVAPSSRVQGSPLCRDSSRQRWPPPGHLTCCWMLQRQRPGRMQQRQQRVGKRMLCRGARGSGGRVRSQSRGWVGGGSVARTSPQESSSSSTLLPSQLENLLSGALPSQLRQQQKLAQGLAAKAAASSGGSSSGSGSKWRPRLQQGLRSNRHARQPQVRPEVEGWAQCRVEALVAVSAGMRLCGEAGRRHGRLDLSA